MRNNGNTENFSLPVFRTFPAAFTGELVVISGHASARSGLYLFLENAWRFVLTELPTGVSLIGNKFSGRRASSLTVDSTTWRDIPITVVDTRDSSYSHNIGDSEIIVTKAARFSVSCGLSAMRSSGKNVSFGIRICTRPSNGNACSGVPIWNTQSIYLANEIVQHNGILYHCNWYSQGQNPAQNSAPYQVWTNLGACTNGPATHTPVDGSYGYGMCDVSDIPTSQVTSHAHSVTLLANSAVKVQIATTSPGSISIPANTFRFNIQEG